MLRKISLVSISLILLVSIASMGAQNKTAIKHGAAVYVAPMNDEFDSYLKSAMEKKKIPLTIVDYKEKADYEISGTSETQKASTAKKVIQLNWHSTEQASISISDLKTGEIVFAYSVNKESSAHGKQSTAEACAKHIKEAIAKK
jgi:hypothetical protein